MIKLYNTLARKKLSFRPIRRDWVTFYACGPTVYDFAHIGNLRTYIFEDILRRTLEYAGYRIRYVMNITDIDDKIIFHAQKKRQSIFEFVYPYKKAFFQDLKNLNIKRAWKYPLATKHISDMISCIQTLIKNRVAYEKDGSVYFNIKKFKRYGKLSGIERKNLRSGVRVDTDEYSKDHIEDFALWKAAKAEEPSWQSPFGKGRPGWHIECSAMSMKYLAVPIDIHAGAVDLIFPHHENEIAQSENSGKKPFVRYWLHGEHLLVNGEKMAKSLGNIITLREIEQKKINPLAFRYFVLGAHYRSKLNFTWDALAGAMQGLNRLYDFIRILLEYKKKTKNKKQRKLNAFKRQFEKLVFDDLDTPQTLAVVWQLVHDYHKTPSQYNSADVLDVLYDFDTILGLGFKHIKKIIIPLGIMKLAEKREAFRKEKKWAEADVIRQMLLKKGWVVEDTPHGSIVKKW